MPRGVICGLAICLPCWAPEMLDALRSLKRGDCWCDVGIGNPMMSGGHSTLCKRIAALMRRIDGDEQ